MLRRDYPNQHCSIAGALELIGERWTLLILRDAFLGTRRFDDFQRGLGIARNVLQARLERLVEEGVFERVRYQERPERHEYRLTEKGVELWPVLLALMQWGDRYVNPDARPTVVVHRDCGGELNTQHRCADCGAELSAWDAEARLGPGAAPHEGRPGELRRPVAAPTPA